MKVVILAGGLGTRLSEETAIMPKPMVRIGGHPIIWHIMNIYSSQGYNEFIVCLGYKGWNIKEYFLNSHKNFSDITIDISTDKLEYHSKKVPNWKVTLVDTGEGTLTGGRLKRVEKYIDGSTFMMTYGDGLADINLDKLLKFHKSHKKIATVTAVRPLPRFGTLDLEDGGRVTAFKEKKDVPWVNGGFFVLSKKVFKYIKGDLTPFEGQPLEQLANDGELFAYKHPGFWKSMDMLSDKNFLEEQWSKSPPWKIWKD